jgi:hypothetical protein
MCHRGLVATDVVIVTEFEEFLSYKLCTIIRDHGVRDSKAMDDVEEKFHGVLGSDHRDRLSLNPLRELVNGDKQMRVTPGCFREGPDQIVSLDREWPRDGDRLECLCRQVGLPSVVLAPFAGAHYPFGARHRSWPVEALPERVPDQGPRHGMMPADPARDILQQLFPLFDHDTTLQYLGVTPFVELSLDDDEGLSTAYELLGLRLLSREHLAEEIVEIRHPRVGRRVGLHRWSPISSMTWRSEGVGG